MKRKTIISVLLTIICVLTGCTAEPITQPPTIEPTPVIYDPDGNEAIQFDEDGEGFFAGVIRTLKDCLIQGELRVGLGGNNTKGISFYGDSYQADANGNYSTPYARMLPYVANNEDFKGINVTDGEFCIEGSPVATKQDIALLTERLDKLKKQLDTMA